LTKAEYLLTLEMTDHIDLCKGNAPLGPRDRSLIISRIHSLLYWLGARIPQQIEVEGEKINLRDIVFNYITKDEHTPKERQQALALADLLAREEKKLEESIITEDLSRKQACELCQEARMLLRAVDELRSSPPEEADVKKDELLKKVSDAKRWDKFVKRLK